MTWRKFVLQLSLFSLIMLVILVALEYIPKLSGYSRFGILCWIIFITLSLGMFFVGQKAANAKNKFAFSNLVIMTMIVKLFLGFSLSILYYQLMEPPNKFFIIPLFVVYLGYTGFETYFMMKLGNQKTIVSES